MLACGGSKVQLQWLNVGMWWLTYSGSMLGLILTVCTEHVDPCWQGSKVKALGTVEAPTPPSYLARWGATAVEGRYYY
jgi:hypothetical protein